MGTGSARWPPRPARRAARHSRRSGTTAPGLVPASASIFRPTLIPHSVSWRWNFETGSPRPKPTAWSQGAIPKTVKPFLPSFRAISPTLRYPGSMAAQRVSQPGLAGTP